MAQILLQSDPTIKQSEIQIGLINPSKEEAGSNYKHNYEKVRQTAVYGILTPLIQVNNTIIDFTQIVDFKLDCKYVLPTISITIANNDQLLLLDKTGNDNVLRVEILPSFDNAYKKINLTFFISNIRITANNIITLTGIYKLPALTSSNIKAFGEINIFDLFKKISIETGLGFATNIESNDQDKHYIYCDNKSYLDMLNREIKYSGSEHQILDYWIDYWNTLNLADMYERYNTIDDDEDLIIWVDGFNEIEPGVKSKPKQIIATLTTQKLVKGTELYVEQFSIVNKSSNSVYQGTDKLYSIYENNKFDYNDHLIQDGDIKNDIYKKFEYLGETYSDFNYLLANKCRDAYLQKINSENLEVVLNSPIIPLMRGHKVNFVNYIHDTIIEDKIETLKKNGILNEEESTLTSKAAIDNSNSKDGKILVDKKTSGQYLITGSSIRFVNNKWKTILTLARPANQKMNQIKEIK